MEVGGWVSQVEGMLWYLRRGRKRNGLRQIVFCRCFKTLKVWLHVLKKCRK